MAQRRWQTRARKKAAGTLLARPVRTDGCARPGVHKLGISPDRDAVLFIPPTLTARPSGALVLSLHGAGGTAEHGLNLLRTQAETYGFAILAPTAVGFSWDVIVSDYGPDVDAIDRCLAAAFERCSIDPDCVAIAGFSDGASYALSLGIANGELFRNVVAFSPGFSAPPRQSGHPRIFVSHGTRDSVLPIDRCSRRLVPQLRSAGYPVDYHEFEGPHLVPEDIKNEAAAWWRHDLDSRSDASERGKA